MMEKWREMKEREERRRNMVIRGVKEGEKDVEKRIREIIRKLGVEAKVEK